MKGILPATNREWGQLCIFPFKAYTMAVPVVVLASIILQPSSNLLYRESGGGETTLAELMRLVDYGYGVCIAGLMLAVVCNPRDKRARWSALVYLVIALVSLVLFIPAAAVAKTKGI